MNSLCYKIIFSKKHGVMVAVGENTNANGKTSGQGLRSGARDFFRFGVLGAALTAFAAPISWGAPLASSLPQGGFVNYGQAVIGSLGANMSIQQGTDKAIINWNSFSIGNSAAVTVYQPNVQSVLLNRVVGSEPSQIFGKLQANGQVILLNQNGVVFGSTGSVTASAFTASTFDLSDADFVKGNFNYQRNNSQAGVTLQKGAVIDTSATPQGYVALLGATVSNSGRVSTQQGDVVMAAGNAATLTNTVKLPLSRRVSLELSPARINTAVENTPDGVIQTRGGQVLMQAASVMDAVSGISSKVVQSGVVDSSGAQAGAVQLLTPGGQIVVNGTVNANSWDSTSKGGDIVIGRDATSGKLSGSTDVSGATLQSKGGWIETSGHVLTTDGVRISAAQWLLDPADVTISTGTDANYTNVTAAGTSTYTPNTTVATSVVNTSTIQTAINSGTNVTITTTNSGTAGTGGGNITIANALAFTNNSGNASTLSLIADNGVIQNAAITASGSSAVNLNFTGKGNFQGSSTASANSLGVNINSNITTNGALTLNGTVNNTATSSTTGIYISYGLALNATGGITLMGSGTNVNNGALSGMGVYFNNTVTLNAGSNNLNITGVGNGGNGIYALQGLTLKGGNVTLNGTANTNSGQSGLYGTYILLNASLANNINATGNIAITGTLGGAGSGVGLGYATNNNNNSNVNKYSAGGSITLNGNSSSASNAGNALYIRSVQATATGNIVLNATTSNANTTSLSIYSNAINSGGAGTGYNGGASSFVSSAGNVSLLANQGSISIYDQVPNATTSTAISGVNVIIDNSGGTFANGTLTAGAGYGSSATPGVNFLDNRTITATGAIIVNGKNTNNGGVGITVGSTTAGLSFVAPNTTLTGTNTGLLVSAINITSAFSASNNLVINGTSSSTAGSTSGVQISTNVTANGAINITSNASAGGAPYGFYQSAGTITAGSGGLTITANNADTNAAIQMAGGVNTTGAINLIGTSTSGAGINLTSTSNITGASVTMNATGGTVAGSQGAVISSGLISTTASGFVNITASNPVGGASYGFYQGAGNISAGTGGITINANNTGVNGANYVNATLNTTGALSITGVSTSTTTGIGATFSATASVSAASISVNGTAGPTGGASVVLNAGGSLTGTGNISLLGAGNNATSVVLSGNVSTSAGSIVVNATNNSNTTAGLSLAGNLSGAAGQNITISGALSGAGNIITGGSTLNLSNSKTSSNIFSGVISGNGSLISSTGLQTLSGNNTYTGNTTISAGTLQVGNAGASGTLGTGNVTNNANLIFKRTDASNSISYAISGTGNVTQAGTGTSIFTANNTYSGTTTISAGTLQIGNGSTSGTLGSGIVTNNATLALDRSDTSNTAFVVSNAINGTGALQQIGTGISVLSANNTSAAQASSSTAPCKWAMARAAVVWAQAH